MDEVVGTHEAVIEALFAELAKAHTDGIPSIFSPFTQGRRARRKRKILAFFSFQF